MPKANRGEWSEIYAFFRLLADQCLFGGDAKLRRDSAVCLKVIKVVKGLLEGTYCENGALVCVSYEKQCKIVKRSELDVRANRLLSAIRSAPPKNGSFQEAETEAFLASIGCRQIKMPATCKRDMDVVVEDVHTGMKPKLGFSVKSFLGSPPTLLNASQTTLFQYEVRGLSEADIAAINAIGGAKKRIKRAENVLSLSESLTFTQVKSPVFRRNLLLLDDAMPKIMAALLESAWFHEKKSLSEACAWVEKRDPCKYGDNKAFYGIKVRRLLRAIALGMVPGTPWEDRDDATGGYIVVCPDGKLVAFYVYNRMMFDDYLFNTTVFEIPSLERNKAMTLYHGEENGRTYIDLCLDIRFNG